MTHMTPLPPGPFGIVLADPPWAFATYNGDKVPQRAAQQHYGTMTRAELLALPVASVCAKDAVLLMWVVDSHYDQALELGRAWGFTYKTKAFTWRKIGANGQTIMGMGHWTRKETESVWLFTRGKPKRVSAGVREIIDAPRGRHSAKPDEQYDRIDALLGTELPRLELFARERRAGWAQWGNEAPGFTNTLGRLAEAI